ncbi:MAG: STAS domain protein [Methanoregulaceae archaeon PtaB.Bin152]|nr:MAG: STAS domain protein [Methanoregulaceae archaeon PtaB.Bin152]
MKCVAIREREVLVLSLEGRLDAQGAMEIEALLKGLILESDNTMVFDMSGVTYMSSAGIRTIVATEKRMKGKGGRIHLCGLQPYPLSVLDMTGFAKVLSILPTRDDAVLAAGATAACDRVAGDHTPLRIRTRGAEFVVAFTGQNGTTLSITGFPPNGGVPGRGGGSAIPVTVSTSACSVGQGAPGLLADTEGSPMGDLLTIGNAAAWLLPGDRDTVDYLVLEKKVADIPITASFLLSPLGPPVAEVQVRSDTPEGIALTDLFDSLHTIAKEARPHYLGILCFSFCADSPDVRVLGPRTADSSVGNFPSAAFLAGCAVVVDTALFPPDFNGVIADALVRRMPGFPDTVPRVTALVFSDLPAEEDAAPGSLLERGLSSGAPALLRHLSPRTRISRATLRLFVISGVRLHTGTRIVFEGDVRGWNADYERITKSVHIDCSEVHLHPISGGYSGSLVFRDDAYDHTGRREMPFVLKLDRWENIQAEIEGYEGHVKRYIQNNATQVIQKARSGGYGGILYTFVGIGGPQSRIFSLEEYYRTHPTDEVLAIFDILFRKVLRSWYGQPRLRDLPLYRVYGDIFRYEDVCNWAESRYGITAADEAIDLPYGLGKSANPLYFMEHTLPERRSQMWSVYEGSVHGDLNMRNVLMDDERNLWLIDFAMTGHSHILRDIAKLESVLMCEMLPIETEERLRDLVALERLLLGPKRLGEIPELPKGGTDPDIEKAFRVVQQLRRYADTITLLDEDIHQYYLALLYYTLCVPAFVSVNEFMREFAWISSSFMCESLMSHGE